MMLTDTVGLDWSTSTEASRLPCQQPAWAMLTAADSNKIRRFISDPVCGQQLQTASGLERNSPAVDELAADITRETCGSRQRMTS
jgi:hypothetical protein